MGGASSAVAAQQGEEIDPRDLQALAILYIEDNQPDAAIPLLERSVDLNPENGETYMWLGVAQFLTERFVLADASFMKALARHPGLTEVRNYRGLMRYKEGDADGAIGEFLTALRDPGYPPRSRARVSLNLGNVYLGIGKPAAAREHFATAAGMVPPNDAAFGPLHVQLARALRQLGRGREAIAALQKVVDADEFSIAGHLELGLAYQHHSQPSAARRHLLKVIELAPGTAASERAEAALAERY